MDLIPEWRQVPPEPFGKSSVLALEHQSGNLLIIAFSDTAGSRALDDIVAGRKRHTASRATRASLETRERRYFCDADEFIPCSLATYTFVDAKDGDRVVHVVLSLIADGRGYEVVGIGVDDPQASERLAPLVSSLKLTRPGTE